MAHDKLFEVLKWISVTLSLFFSGRKFYRWIRRKLRSMKKPTV